MNLTRLKLKTFIWFLILTFFQFSCTRNETINNQEESKQIPLFTTISSTQSGINFKNQITEDSKHHYFYYPYLYNGGGVAAGDINNDGLPDLYFTGNLVPDELYINMGDLSFRNITKEAGIIHSKESWHTGVVMWDANADGLLDIYVCRSGKNDSPDIRTNLLYLNNGNETFTESAAVFGLGDAGHSTQAYPFDCDNDGDLDFYVVNHRVDFIKNSYYDFEDDKIIDDYSSDQLYRNNGNNSFSDISRQAGIQNKAWGLSAAIGDFNKDGWDDIFVANDFHQPDYLYINNKDGSFSEDLQAYFKHSSFYSMGSDLADINNDGLADLIVLDMVSESHLRSKRMMASMNTDNFRSLVKNGYHYQYMINTLQLNNGIGFYSEIGQLAGVSKTDWSWAPLLADFNNDGLKDLFVTNGIKKDVTDNDFRIEMEKELQEKGSMNWENATNLLPSSTIPNYIFQNTGNLKFTNQTDAWGMSTPVNSNGVVYADLDQDGDLELVVNNMDETAQVYRNMNRENEEGNYIQIKLKGPPVNPFALGASVRIFTGSQKQFQRVFPSRGFQSAVNYSLHFGLGKTKTIDSLEVIWPDGKYQKLESITGNTEVVIVYDNTAPSKDHINDFIEDKIFTEVSEKKGLNFLHQENEFDDFMHEVLLPHKQSELGPMISKGDVNNDQLEDFFIGGAYQQAGCLFLQQGDGSFVSSSSQPWEADKESEDLESLFIDVDLDGDQDLYIISGGAIFLQNSPQLQDRLYINDGHGNFKRDLKALPDMRVSTCSVCAGDFDGDGDPDLFIGGRLIPGQYPLSPRSFLLENDNGTFKDVTNTKAPSLMNPGLINDGMFTDFDNDNDLDLIVVGEWMAISLFENQGGIFNNVTKENKLSETTGWWSRIIAVDWDHDGDEDYIVGNMGDNNKFNPNSENPLYIYANDFDHNGSLDMYLAKEKDNIKLPFRGRECSSQQLPGIIEKFPTYNDFGMAQLEDVLGADEMENAFVLDIKLLNSCLLINEKGTFNLVPLPVEAQFSQINGIITEDFNADGFPDLLIAGNNLGAEPETARYDASNGALFLNDTVGGFIYIPNSSSGFVAPQNVKSLTVLKIGNPIEKSLILVGNNNAKLTGFEHYAH